MKETNLYSSSYISAKLIFDMGDNNIFTYDSPPEELQSVTEAQEWASNISLGIPVTFISFGKITLKIKRFYKIKNTFGAWNNQWTIICAGINKTARRQII